MRLAFAIVSLLLGAPLMWAGPLDPETKTPYQWRVVVSVATHPSLTAAVRNQVCRDVKAAVQEDLGEALGVVEVIDLAVPDPKREPLLASFDLSGWPALEREEFRKLTGKKTHFVRVEAADGQFRISTRQHDGDSGLLSPLVRSRSTNDVGKIGRLAGLLVIRDFGPVGTVERLAGEPPIARVTFRGAELPGFENWLKTGDVLSFSVIREQPRPQTKSAVPGAAPVVDRIAQPREFTYLVITEVGLRGEYKAKVISRFAQPFATGRGVVGHRAMKLTTAEAAVVVRLADEKGGTHPDNFRPQIWAGRNEFTTMPTNTESMRFRDGKYESIQSVKGLACITVRIDSSTLQPFPVPVLGSENPTTLRFSIDPEKIARVEFERRCEKVARDARDVLDAQTDLFKGLGPLITAGEFKVALDRATKGLKALAEAEQEVSGSLSELKKDPKAVEPTATRSLTLASERLISFAVSKPELERKIEDLKEAIARAEDPVKADRDFKAKELQREVGRFLARGEVPEAAAKLDELYELTKQDEVKQRKENLLQDWAPKSDAHRQARDFLLDEWRKASEVPEFANRVKKLAEVVDIFAANNDKLGLLNLRGSIASVGERLKQFLDVLDENTEGDLEKINAIKAIDLAMVAADKKALDALSKLKDLKEK